MAETRRKRPLLGRKCRKKFGTTEARNAGTNSVKSCMWCMRSALPCTKRQLFFCNGLIYVCVGKYRANSALIRGGVGRSIGKMMSFAKHWVNGVLKRLI